MATLYVENVPKELYEALRSRARAQRRSMAAVVLALLEETIPTGSELIARREFLRRLERVSSKRRRSRRRFATTEQMQREDRAR